MPQSVNVKESDDLGELVAWMERLLVPYEVAGELLARRIDHFQIIPLEEGGYMCVVLWSELPGPADWGAR